MHSLSRRLLASVSVPLALFFSVMMVVLDTGFRALSERSLQELYPHLNWIMTLSAPVQEIQAPLVELRRHLVVLVLVIVLLTVAAALLLSRVESAPVVPEDPHLERL